MTNRTAHTGPLNARQRQILTLLGEGKTNIAISRELGIALQTVHDNVKAVYKKLDLPSTRAAIFRAGIAEGLRYAADLAREEEHGAFALYLDDKSAECLP